MAMRRCLLQKHGWHTSEVAAVTLRKVMTRSLHWVVRCMAITAALFLPVDSKDAGLQEAKRRGTALVMNPLTWWGAPTPWTCLIAIVAQCETLHCNTHVQTREHHQSWIDPNRPRRRGDRRRLLNHGPSAAEAHLRH